MVRSLHEGLTMKALGVLAGIIYSLTAGGIWYLCMHYLLPQQWYEPVRDDEERWWPTWRMVGWLYVFLGAILTTVANIATWHSYLTFSGRGDEFTIFPSAGWVLTGIILFWFPGFLAPVLGKEFSAWLDWQDQRNQHGGAKNAQPE